MIIPTTLKVLEVDDEDQILDTLNQLSVDELLKLQQLADKITELLLIVFLARDEYGVQQNDEV